MPRLPNTGPGNPHLNPNPKWPFWVGHPQGKPPAQTTQTNPDWYWPVSRPRLKWPSILFRLKLLRVPPSEEVLPVQSRPVRRAGWLRQAARRIQFVDPPWPQVPVPDPVFPLAHHRVVVDAPRRRGRYVDPPWTAVQAPAAPVFPFSEIHARVRFQEAFKTRFMQPVQAQDGSLPPRLRRPAVGVRARRGASWMVVPPQVPVPLWPPPVSRIRIKPALLRKGNAHFIDFPWFQASQGGGGTVLLQRTLVGTGL